jgi:antitoxin (DNA-binding transcriptional repressor) of toxin-antitoxin stability system
MDNPTSGVMVMSISVSIDEAQSRLRDLIRSLGPGDEVVITENERAVAKLSAQSTAAAIGREPGFGQGMIAIVADDDEHLEDFQEYMP